MAAPAGSPFAVWAVHLREPRLRAAFAIGFCILFAFIGTFTYVNFVLVREPLSLGMMSLGFVYFVFLPSVVTTLLARFIQENHVDLAAHATWTNPAMHNPVVLQFWNLATVTGRAALDAEINIQAATIAYLNDFKLMMYVMLLAVPMLVIMRRPKRRAAPSAEQMVME